MNIVKRRSVRTVNRMTLFQRMGKYFVMCFVCDAQVAKLPTSRNRMYFVVLNLAYLDFEVNPAYWAEHLEAMFASMPQVHPDLYH